MNIKITKKEFVFPLTQTYFKECHASTFVEAPNGDFLVAYFAGDGEGKKNSNIWISRCFMGTKWTEPCLLEAGSSSNWNPVFFKYENRIFLFFKEADRIKDWVTYCIYSDDNGYSWSERTVLDLDNPFSRGPSRNKVIVASDGSWLAPGSIETSTTFDSFVDRSLDHGRTWEIEPIPIAHNEGSHIFNEHVWYHLSMQPNWEEDRRKKEKVDGIIQPTLWTSGETDVHALMRSTRGHLYRSDSIDNGKTWCQAYETNIPNNNSGIDIAKLSNGLLALVYNPIPWNWGGRSPISIALSGDNGITFSDPIPLETLTGELSYPSVNAFGNLLRITFTYDRKSIMYCECVIEE